ncbi:hypothetical protein [Streptomyces sp. NPDC088757]|uniref:hypothetical protein n=1 Tax=Streptomyces sp. NPDC088757 TaxID=3365889 RepID=UPI0037FEF40D
MVVLVVLVSAVLGGGAGAASAAVPSYGQTSGSVVEVTNGSDTGWGSPIPDTEEDTGWGYIKP